jgi:hypothetical protein
MSLMQLQVCCNAYVCASYTVDGGDDIVGGTCTVQKYSIPLLLHSIDVKVKMRQNSKEYW